MYNICKYHICEILRRNRCIREENLFSSWNSLGWKRTALLFSNTLYAYPQPAALNGLYFRKYVNSVYAIQYMQCGAIMDKLRQKCLLHCFPVRQIDQDKAATLLKLADWTNCWEQHMWRKHISSTLQTETNSCTFILWWYSGVRSTHDLTHCETCE